MKSNIIIFKYSWILLIIISLCNSTTAFRKIKRCITNSMESELYKKVLIYYTACNVIPWIVMGLSIEHYGIESIFDFISPKDNISAIIPFHITAALILIFETVWIFYFEGSIILTKHPIFVPYTFTKELLNKLLHILFVVFFCVFEFLIWTHRIVE